MTKKHSKKEAKQILQSLGYILVSDYKNSASELEVQCINCDTIFTSSLIKLKARKKCQFCMLPKVGDTNGMNTVIRVIPSKSGRGGEAVIRCECGIERQIPTAMFKNLQTCGNCGIRRNGFLTSSPALALNKLINEILGIQGEHNKQLPYVGNVDIFYPQYNYVIEYSPYYTHIRLSDRTISDQAKYKRILKEGYCLLIIKAGGKNKDDIPTKQQLQKILLNDFKHGSKKKTLTLYSYKQALAADNDRENRRQKQGGGSLQNRWTRSEDIWLLKYYLDSDWPTILQNIPNHSKVSILGRWGIIKPQNTRSKKLWTQEQDQYLLDNYISQGVEACAQFLKKGVPAIYFRWNTIKPQDIDFDYSCRPQTPRAWTQQEDQYIKDNYCSISTKQCAKHLNRTPEAVQLRWRVIKPPNKKHSYFWSQEDVNVLIKNYKLPLKQLYDLLPNRTPSTIKQKRRKLLKKLS